MNIYKRLKPHESRFLPALKRQGFYAPDLSLVISEPFDTPRSKETGSVKGLRPG
jgi:hypothetical protein